MNARGFGLGVFTVLSLSLVETPAVAQVCLSVPLGIGQTSLGMRADMPDGGNVFGIRAANQVAEALAVAAEYSVSDPEVGDATHSLGADVAIDLPLAALEDAGAGLCVVAGANVSLADDPRTILVPVGVALGASFEVDSGIAIAPFVVPHLQWSRMTYPEIDASSNTSFAVRGGANLVVSNLFFGALIGKVFEDYADAIFGVQAGIIF